MSEATENPTEPHWRRLGTRELYRGRVLLTEHEVELPGGGRTTFEVNESSPFAVAVLLAPTPDEVIVARQYRYAPDRWIYDLPGGAGDEGEEPEDAARRECREEVGLVPGRLVHLHTFFLDPGRYAWPLHVYFATDFEEGEADSSDPSEQVFGRRMPLRELDALISSGEVVDPALMVGRTFAGLKGLLPLLGSL
ncbi:NUDIX hydrolase [Frondihabitans cladoniiphilus]|uniref:NUDIX hydrolase n=1 Tax=Frondihabitans cladoniiphilus TaxID=715785 RepID=A0ABP8VNK9_9MICO